jgi:hypothetical protein
MGKRVQIVCLLGLLAWTVHCSDVVETAAEAAVEQSDHLRGADLITDEASNSTDDGDGDIDFGVTETVVIMIFCVIGVAAIVLICSSCFCAKCIDKYLCCCCAPSAETD